ncbi:MAG TPA: DUF5977 domain-containing protein [Puia sp.]|nr:DUF5977 domain-containing protein [Puia sp.]
MNLFRKKHSWLTGILLLVLTPFSKSNAQSSTSLSFPSANNTFLGTAGISQGGSSVSVDQFTGTGRVQIPLCDLASRDLDIPVGLIYSGGRGIRVQDYAGQAGLGWILNAGGGISRVVRGFPDEGYNGYIGTGQWGKKVVTYINGGSLDAGLSASPPTGDGEPDLFYIKTPFFSVQFTFDENGNAVTPNNSGLQVIATNMYNSGSYNTSSFKVIDDKGNQYFFGSTAASVEETYSKIYGTNYYFPTTWYLDKIVSFNSKDVITFNYTAAPKNDTTYHYLATATYDIYGNMNMDSTHPIMTVVSTDKYVSSIQSSLGEVDFTYGFDRRDDPNAGRLKTIVLKGYNPQTLSNSTLLETFTFNSSYFGDPTSDPNLLRLRLDNIGLTGNNPDVPSLTYRTFAYNTSTNLPNRKLFEFQDFFGYYNYNPNITNYAFPNNSRVQYLPATLANILTSVTDITGATWTLTYEQNDYYNGSANTPGCGVRVNKIAHTLPTGENLFTTYSYVDGSAHSTGQIFGMSYQVIGYVIGYITQIMSESPSYFYDLNGNANCYSSVRTTAQNGGYMVSQFSNFSDFPDAIQYIAGTNPNSIPLVTSSTSLAYKRGLLLNEATYTSINNKVTEDLAPLTSYVSKTSPVQGKSWAYKYFNISYSVGGSSGSQSYASIYATRYENFLLTSTTHKDYDQVTPANYIQNVTNYIYAPDNRLIRSIVTNNSKGLNCSKTYYYADDAGIPMLTPAEQTALTAAIAPGSNATALLVHEGDTCGLGYTEVHNSFVNYTYGTGSRVFMGSSATYTGSTAVQQESFQYDAASANLVTSNSINGKPESVQYGYNGSLPVAKVINATNVYTYTNQAQTQTLNVNIPPGNFGTQYASFTSSYTGTITLTITPGSWLGQSGGATALYSYYLSGPSSQGGNLCESSTPGYTCSYSNTVSFSNMPPGTYQLQIGDLNNTANATVSVAVTYQGNQIISSNTSEFFYEGFEENASATAGAAHTGNRYWNGNYTTAFALPNGRSYMIQWWNLSGGKWLFNEAAYTGATTLTGPVDDVRIFPKDALMTTYTYQPLVGPTSEIKPNGLTTTQQYDYLNRLYVVRDQDNNIQRKICYNYAGAPASCALFYNPVMTQYFQKSCPAGWIGSQVPYTVAANTYVTDINQGTANQMAQDDINANGQNNANNNGSCNCGPSFTYASGITPIIVNQISVSGTKVSFTFVFGYPSGSTSFYLGNIVSSCAFPTSTRTIPYLTGSSVYDIIVSATGQVTIQWVSGPILSGTVGFSSSYDINANAFYSRAESGTFQKACTSPQVGSYVTYSVPQYRYSSTVSQAAADQLAINDVNANGQNYANTNGTCNTPCSFSWASNITNHLQNTISSSGSTVSFTLVFVSPSNGYTGGTIGSITGGCLPSGTRTVSVTDGGNSSRHWSVTIQTNGSVSISFQSGPATTNTYPPIVLSGSFNL